MALDIGLSPINKNVVRKILLANMLVFVSVLAVFCLAVYGYAVSQDLVELKDKLAVFTDSLIDSIDHDEQEPDIMSQSQHCPNVVPPLDIKIEWYSLEGALLGQRGELQISKPFSATAEFETQLKPHLLLLTRPAVLHGKLIGYARVAQSLAKYDAELHRLATSLVVGVLASLSVSALGIYWLMAQSLKPIEETFLRLRRFTDDVSHELRSPLMALKSNLSLVLRHSKQLEPEYRERLVTAQQAADQMTKLSQDLLVLATADHNKAPEEHSEVDVRKLVAQILSERELLAREKGIEVLNMCNGDGKLAVRGNFDEIFRMVGNVIDNALLYTPESGRVTIRSFQSSNQVTIQVIDTGIGIAQDDLPRVFERFWRADRARSFCSGGTGLGLAIAKTLANQHGGDIIVSSKIGEGSCFEIVLPTV